MISITQLDVEHYEVTVGDLGAATTHRVRLTPEHWRALTERRVTPEGLLMESFRWLLARAPGEALPPEVEFGRMDEQYPGLDAHLAAWVERGR